MAVIYCNVPWGATDKIGDHAYGRDVYQEYLMNKVNMKTSLGYEFDHDLCRDPTNDYSIDEGSEWYILYDVNTNCYLDLLLSAVIYSPGVPKYLTYSSIQDAYLDVGDNPEIIVCRCIMLTDEIGQRYLKPMFGK